ncbi:MAG TPA: choice-of-anchor tandem repeat GloVer-containing protein [Terriglobales bacterium]|nr:choice-of-anchor tandem repeat GloVer-containing protein [Terriglobales bacterium]
MKANAVAPILAELAIFLLIFTPVSRLWAGSKYTVLHAFTGASDGGTPSSADVLLDNKGRVYGATTGGGANRLGAVYRLSRLADGGWNEVVLYSFTGHSDGYSPNSGLVSDVKGNLYGTAVGGAQGKALAYELRPGSRGWTLTALYDGGAGPGVILDSADNLYGGMGKGQFGGGAISELIHSSKGWTLKTLYSFCDPNCGYGEGLYAPLTWDAAGNLYGTTFFGGNGPPKCPGSLGCGVAFQMTPNSDGTWKYHVLHRFAAFPNDGQYPDGGLVVDAAGNAYGVTAYGGVHGNGTVFKLTPASGGQWKQTVLYDFSNCANGCFPGTTLVFDKAGDLYGVGSGGLADCQGYTCGLVFKLAPQAGGKWKYSVVHKFTGTDGGFPNGVIIDDKGNLFGTTQAFGTFGYGVAFEITP